MPERDVRGVPPEGEPATVDRYGHKMSEQATMPLLDYVAAHTLDEDYAYASQRRAVAAGEDRPRRGSRGIGTMGALVMVAFAVLVVTAALQTSHNMSADRRERAALVRQVTDARTQLDQERTRMDALTRETTTLRSQELARDRSTRGLVSRISQLGVLAGTVPVSGPGVRVRADDAPGATSAKNKVLDSDLQRLVNGFWEAGAEAVSINGQRLTNLSTIRLAGSAITVNSHSLRRPYVVTAIGNKDTLPARFAETSSGQAWLDLKQEVGLQLTITPESSLRVPAAEVPTLRYANRKAGGPS